MGGRQGPATASSNAKQPGSVIGSWRSATRGSRPASDVDQTEVLAAIVAWRRAAARRSARGILVALDAIAKAESDTPPTTTAIGSRAQRHAGPGPAGHSRRGGDRRGSATARTTSRPDPMTPPDAADEGIRIMNGRVGTAAGTTLDLDDSRSERPRRGCPAPVADLTAGHLPAADALDPSAVYASWRSTSWPAYRGGRAHRHPGRRRIRAAGASCCAGPQDDCHDDRGSAKGRSSGSGCSCCSCSCR